MKGMLLANKRKIAPNGQLTLQWVSSCGGDNDSILENRCCLCDGRVVAASSSYGRWEAVSTWNEKKKQLLVMGSKTTHKAS